MTPAPFFAGALCAFGLFIAVRSLRTVRPADAPVGTTDPGPSGTAASWPSNPVGRIGSMARRGSMALGLDPGRRCSGDLAVTGRSPEDHAARALIAGTWLAALVLLVTAALHSAGAAIGGPVVLGGAAVAFLAGPFMAELALRSEANGRREDLRVDLGAFAELMVLLLAAGSGVEGALAHAAEAGDDWTWRQLRNALRAARLTRRSSAEALSSLGRELEVTELEELGAAVDLAASSGTRLRASLTARAEALRARELARTQAQAASATERMTFPVVALALGFLVVLGYPALSKVMTSF